MSNQDALPDFLDFLNASPTPYHAVVEVERRLQAQGFTLLAESDAWSLSESGRYYFKRRDASLIAFIVGSGAPEEVGLRLAGAHTDSPTLKAKPRPEKSSHGYAQVGIEVYGGVLLHPWFDRDLSLAGRVTVRQASGLRHRLVNFGRPLAVIPSLAIHLDRSANEGRSVNAEEQMRPIFGQLENFSIRQLLADELAAQGAPVAAADVLEYDLSFYDVQPAGRIGVHGEFIASARLDNLLSCYACLLGLLATAENDCEATRVVALFDHEEVGSRSDIGANSNLLPNLLERLAPQAEQRQRATARSVLVSVDNAHGVHPNFANRHEQGQGPKLNEGPVIKVDANQSYATSSETAALLHLLASQSNVPLQSYVTRADMRCGSTIGPISAARMGMATVDVGAPTFAMHSIRELAGTRDVNHLSTLLQAFFRS